jgi:hypothetical protein
MLTNYNDFVKILLLLGGQYVKTNDYDEIEWENSKISIARIASNVFKKQRQ